MLSSPLDAQPPALQDAFHFPPATAMHEAGKFELLNVAEVDGQWRYTFRCSVRAKCRESD